MVKGATTPPTMAEINLEPDNIEPRNPIIMLMTINSIRLSLMLIPLIKARKNITTNKIGINVKMILTQGMLFFSLVITNDESGGMPSGLFRCASIPGLWPAPTTATTLSCFILKIFPAR